MSHSPNGHGLVALGHNGTLGHEPCTTAQETAREQQTDTYDRFVANEIKRVTDPIYCQEGIKIVDARNHIFRLSDTLRTDEAEDTYALSDLCIVDEDMQTVPNRQRMYRIARNYWNG